jgi:hypothetical protein
MASFDITIPVQHADLYRDGDINGQLYAHLIFENREQLAEALAAVDAYIVEQERLAAEEAAAKAQAVEGEIVTQG